MASYDGDVNIKTRLDTSELDKDTQQLKNKVDKIGNIAGKLKTAVTATAVTAAIKKTVDALNECTAAYETQAKAEKALQVAADNNPYLNSESVAALKNFSGELQKVTEIGDEVSLSVMAQLAATGRTEQQIMDIMSAAADMSAVTGKDIAQVAQQLNKTFSGLAGELGEANSQIRTLTKEELENGGAIKIVADQYKGMAEQTASVTVQMSNAWGDFKENIGAGWGSVTKPVKEFFIGVLNQINEAASKTRELKDANAARDNGTSTAASTKILVDDAQRRVDELHGQIQAQLDLLADEDALAKKVAESRGYVTKATIIKAAQDLQTQYETELLLLHDLTAEYEALTAAEKAEADATAAAATEAEKKAAIDARNASVAEYKGNAEAALQAHIDAMELRAKLTGEEIDTGELYNAYLNAYIELITKSNGEVTENNELSKRWKAIIDELKVSLDEAATEEERLAAAAELNAAAEAAAAEEFENAIRARAAAEEEAAALLDEAKNAASTSYIDDYIAEQARLLQLKDQINDNEILSEQEKNDALLAIDTAYAQNKAALWETITSEINSYTQQAAQVAQDAAALMLESVESETTAELAALDEKYNKGELSEEEYNEKVKAIKKKAAQEEYKIKMFEWTASMLAATANIAEGVTKAIAQGGMAGIITGALVGAAGAVQIASIIASKPVPPQFASGGVIGGIRGASYGSDDRIISARSGEMVLNAVQQRGLWDKLSSGRYGGDGINLTVNNTQAGRVDTSIRQDNTGLIIEIVDKHINKGFRDGTYDEGIAGMNTRTEGYRYI